VLRDLGDLTGTRTGLERAIEIGEATPRPPTTHNRHLPQSRLYPAATGGE
jgi:hypothetical protein